MSVCLSVINLSVNFVVIFISQLYSWRNGEFQELEDLLVPDVARSVVWSKESLCVGFKREYSLIKVCHYSLLQKIIQT